MFDLEREVTNRDVIECVVQGMFWDEPSSSNSFGGGERAARQMTQMDTAEAVSLQMMNKRWKHLS